MRVVAVHTAVRYQSVHMKRGIVLLTVVYRIHQSGVFKKCAVLNLFRNSGKLLIYDTACSHIQMSYLRISHLAVRKSDRHTACISFHERTFLHQFVHDRRFGLCNRIPLCFLIQTVAI